MPTKDKVIKEFEFDHAGHRFFCSVEVPGQAGMRPWWWFRLDTGAGTRHAPFEVSAGDTKQSVQTRIVAYYTELLAIQARPVHQRPVWQKPQRPTPPAEAVAVSPPLSEA
jgi:hypothetical protein